MLAGLFDAEIDVTDILSDNKSYMKMTENPVLHDKTKHIEVRYHYIQDMVQKGDVKLKYVPIEEQVANVLTKPLAHVKFEYFRANIGIVWKDLSRKREWKYIDDGCSGEQLGLEEGKSI